MKHKTLTGSFNGYFWDVIKNQYTDFEGRSSREQYWMFFMWWIVVVFSLTIVSFGVLGLLAGVLLFIPGLAIQVRRLHDIDMSGWWLLGLNILASIPFLNIIVIIYWIYLYIKKGDKGNNRFGAPAK